MHREIMKVQNRQSHHLPKGMKAGDSDGGSNVSQSSGEEGDDMNFLSGVGGGIF